MFKRQLSEVFLAVQIAVTGNAALIASKLKEIADMLIAFGGELSPFIGILLSMVRVDTTYTQNSVCLRTPVTYGSGRNKLPPRQGALLRVQRRVGVGEFAVHDLSYDGA